MPKPVTPVRRLDWPALGLGLLALLCTPWRILADGYLPPDDALRHAAFAVGHRSWDQILVGRPEALFDQSPGWHALLRGLHQVLGWDARALVGFEVAALLALFLVAGLPWVRRWESWALSLVLLFLADPSLLKRVALGRPFLVTAAFALCVLGSTRLSTARPRRSWLHLGWLLGAALCTWVHGSWYLLLLLPLTLAVVGRLAEALRLACCILAGAVLGALLTGHPLTFLAGQWLHMATALGGAPVRGLAMELAPGAQALLPLVLAALLGLLNRGRLRAPWLDAALALGVLGWFLGHVLVWRFFLDWGFPALALWMAWQVDDLLDDLLAAGGKRLPLALLASALFTLTTTANLSGRWNLDVTTRALDASWPAQARLLPDPGGILYANSMTVFYGTFFKNPDGPWRYVLGYEPALMTPADFQVYQASLAVNAPFSALAPWIARMTPQDRLLLAGNPTVAPNLPALTWTHVAPDQWVGRKP